MYISHSVLSIQILSFLFVRYLLYLVLNLRGSFDGRCSACCCCYWFAIEPVQLPLLNRILLMPHLQLQFYERNSNNKSNYRIRWIDNEQRWESITFVWSSGLPNRPIFQSNLYILWTGYMLLLLLLLLYFHRLAIDLSPHSNDFTTGAWLRGWRRRRRRAITIAVAIATATATIIALRALVASIVAFGLNDLFHYLDSQSVISNPS